MSAAGLADAAGLSVAELEDCRRGLPGDVLRLVPEDRLLIVSPLSLWRTAALVSAAQQAGAQVWRLEDFCPRTAFELMREKQITFSDWLPWQMQDFLDAYPAPETIATAATRHRAAWVGGARVPFEMQTRLVDYWGPILFQHLSQFDWPGCFVATSEQLSQHPASSGFWRSGETCDPDFAEAKLADKFGQMCQPEQIGGLAITPAPKLLGYFDEQRFFLQGMLANAIETVHGWLTPVEAEQLLERHPAVSEAALIVVPGPSEQAGQSASAASFYAAVELVQEYRPGTPLLEVELLDYCARALSAEKCPVALAFVSTLPRTNSGAVDFAALADLF